MKRTKKRFLAALLLLCFSALLLPLCGCRQVKAEHKDDGKPFIVATIFPPYDFAREIGADLIDARMLIRPGTDAHSYDPTPSDIRAIENCDIFIYTGGESEAWAKELLDSIGNSGHSSPQVISMLETVKPLEEETPSGAESQKHSHMHDEDAEAPEYDEHVWTSPKNAIAVAKAIKEALAKADPAHAADYTNACSRYQSQLSRLDSAYRTVVQNSRLKTVLFADRFPFRYLTEEYGLQAAAAFPGCSSESEPSVKTMAFLIDTVRAENIPYVFTVERSNRSIADTIAAETGAGVLEMHSCHTLSAAELARGESYLSLMYKNLENLKRGLQYAAD